jgi:hypothetical protein
MGARHTEIDQFIWPLAKEPKILDHVPPPLIQQILRYVALRIRPPWNVEATGRLGKPGLRISGARLNGTALRLHVFPISRMA